MDGIHLLGEWYGCPADLPEMNRADALRRRCIEAVERSGLTIVGERFHQFEPQGVTGAVILAESHLAIHTWPETGDATLDVYVCNFSRDNSARARQVFHRVIEVLAPAEIVAHEVVRGRLPVGV